MYLNSDFFLQLEGLPMLATAPMPIPSQVIDEDVLDSDDNENSDVSVLIVSFMVLTKM